MKAEQAAFQLMLEATALLDQCGELVIVGGWVHEIHFPMQSHIRSIDLDVVLIPLVAISLQATNRCSFFAAS